MASKMPRRTVSKLPFYLQVFSRQRTQQPCLRCLYSTGPEKPTPTLLSRLRVDLKTAMRARDTARLSVLRGVLADITNSSKTATPINDDLALLSLLKKRISVSKGSIQEFHENNRKDLAAKEQEQLVILEEYAGGVKTMSEEDIHSVVTKVIEGLRRDGKKLTIGDAMKKILGPGSSLDGQMVEKPVVARIVKDVLTERSSL